MVCCVRHEPRVGRCATTETAQRQRPGTAPSSGGGLVGREALTDELTGVLQAACRSRGGAAVLRGPAGIGKSSLLTVAGSAGNAAGMLVLTAKGVRNESGLPFAGLHQLIRPLLSGLAQLPDRQAELLRSATRERRPTGSVSPWRRWTCSPKPRHDSPSSCSLTTGSGLMARQRTCWLSLAVGWR